MIGDTNEPGLDHKGFRGAPTLNTATPVLSIGVPVYNGAAFLGEALNSILNQGFHDFEIVISDNASTDATAEIAQRFSEIDSRISVRRNETNVGLRANFNLLVSFARGRYFKWASADDVLQPGYLQRCVDTLEGDPSVTLAYPRTEFVDEVGRHIEMIDPGWHLVAEVPQDRMRYVIESGHVVNSILGVIRTEALRKTRLLPGYPGGDYSLLGELSLLGRFVEIPETLYKRRIHSDSSKGNIQDAAWLQEYWSGTPKGPQAAYWRLCGDHARTIIESSLPLQAKLGLLRHLGRVMIHRRSRLLAELRSLIPSRRE